MKKRQEPNIDDAIDKYKKQKVKKPFYLLVETVYKIELLAERLGFKTDSRFIDELIKAEYKKHFKTDSIY